MESRWCRLAVEAQSRGVLDFSAPMDWRWTLKESLVLGSLEDELVAEVNKLAHHWHCSAAQVTGWDEQEELFEYHKKQAKRAYNIIGKNRLPWYKVWEITEEKPLDQLWKEFKEAEKNPEYAAHLRELRDDLRKTAGEGQERREAFDEVVKRHEQRKAKMAARELQRR